MKAFLGCDIGRMRDENQDSIRADDFPDGVLALVCDGMGGERNGRAASKIAIDAAEQTFREEYRPGSEPSEILALLRRCVDTANIRVYNAAGENRGRMGTTLVGAFCRDNVCCLVHVGDSRAYLIRPSGQAEQITTDHTVVQYLYEQGVIKAEERETHARRNELMRAVGIANRVLSDARIFALREGERVLLCSDGLYGMIDIETLGRLAIDTPPEQFPEKAIALANENGGRDNISVILLLA